ncbi:DUF6286 domain-containing protein [Fodinicola feengrottensis]|uniref:DUF6286 domain-containing protein n=1 Tax=Fodinicola feengrottensis TaxID=435914 RepID=A0ABP4T0Y7_9ACTN|nr:DUF6286 domain-containing protein [Fodinicola feengrottensis]
MRLVNRMLALVIGIAMVAIAVLVTVEVVLANLGQARWLIPYQNVAALLAGRTWQSSSVRAVLVAVAVVGLVLLISQLWPRQRRFVELSGAADGIDPVLPRSSLRKAIDAAAAAEDGVRATAVNLGPRRAIIRLVTTRHDEEQDKEVATRVAQRVTQRIADIGLARPPRVTVRVITGGDR